MENPVQNQSFHSWRIMQSGCSNAPFKRILVSSTLTSVTIRPVRIVVIMPGCLPEDGSSILPLVAKVQFSAVYSLSRNGLLLRTQVPCGSHKADMRGSIPRYASSGCKPTLEKETRLLQQFGVLAEMVRFP